MMTRATILLLSLFGVGILLPLSALGDRLITNNGVEYEGSIIERGDKYVLTTLKGNTITFQKSDVRRVIRDATVPGKSPTSRPASITGPQRAVKRTVFAVGFDNATGKDQYDPVAAGMGDIVAVLLAQQDNITMVERQQLLALTAEQARSLKGLTGQGYAIRAGKLLKADTVLTGRLFLLKDKLTVNVKAIDIPSERVIAADQISCRPVYLMEASLQVARKLGKQMLLPLPEIDLQKIDKSPIASLHFAKALSHYYAGNMDAAIMQFMRTVDLDPDYIEAHDWAGASYFRLGENAHAIIEWAKYLKRAPDNEHTKAVRQLLAEAKRREKSSTVERLGPKVDKPDKSGSKPAGQPR